MKSPDPAAAKRRAAAAAMALVAPGMRLGLGTGTTAACFIDLLGTAVAGGLKVLCAPTSERTRAQAEALSIPLLPYEKIEALDLTIDGADEFDSDLRLIKGGGGALWREKIVAAASKRMVVIADETKAVAQLGQFPLPVEVGRFGVEATRRALLRTAEACGCSGEIGLRRKPDGAVFVTDSGNYILDCHFGRIAAPDALARGFDAVTGVVEHGLFIGLATAIIVAGPEEIKIWGQLG